MTQSTFFGKLLNYEVISTANVDEAKNIVQIVFPAKYKTNIFKEMLDTNSIAFLVKLDTKTVGLYYSVVSGGILYIRILGILAPYRRSGIGTAVVGHFNEIAKSKHQVTAARLHVQENNQAALLFYKSFDFNIVEKTDKYYRNMHPSGAFVLSLSLT